MTDDRVLTAVVMARPTALDVAFAHNAPIWYRQVVAGGYGRGPLVPGFFGRYAAIRVAVVLVDRNGGHHAVYVSPTNVHARLDDDERGNDYA